MEGIEHRDPDFAPFVVIESETDALSADVGLRGNQHMNPRVVISVVLLVAGSFDLWFNSAFACSCFSSKETATEVRRYIQALYDGAENIVVLRAIKVTEVGDSHEQAELEVVESWKGRFSVGDVVRSDTSSIGAGMCDAPVRAGEEIFLAFDSEPVRINGCPEDFVLSKLERRYLKRLSQKTANESNVAQQSVPADARRLAPLNAVVMPQKLLINME